MTDGDRQLVRFRLFGFRWTADRGFEADLRRLAPHLHSPESAGAVLVKRSLARSVFRLALGPRTVFIKRHRPRSLAERLKYLVVRSRASAEWEAAGALAGRGIAAASAVAFGEKRVGGVLVEAMLISAQAGGIPLRAALLEAGADAATGERFRRKRALVAAVARLVRDAHDADLLHRDLHGGNILVDGDRLCFIYLHRVRVGAPVSRRRRAASVGQLFAHLGGLLTCGDRCFFLRQYLGGNRAPTEFRTYFTRVSRAMQKVQEGRYESRTKRCVRASTGFRSERRGGALIYRRADFPADDVLRAIELHNAKAQNPSGKGVLKCDGRTRVTVVELPGAPACGPLCVKEFIRPKLAQRVRDFFLGSPARAAWLGANACAVRGVSTPTAFAAAEAGPRSFFICEYVDGAVRFIDYVSDLGRAASREAVMRRREFITQAADFVRRVHSHALRHRDLAGKNILLREQGGRWEFYLVDLGDVRLGRAPSLRFRILNLAQLDHVYVKPPRTDRFRFLLRYARGRPELRSAEIIGRIDAMSRARRQRWLERGMGRQVLEERKRQGKPA